MRRIQYLPTQNAGRNSLNLLEDTVKVKLIGKTDLLRDFLHGQISGIQQRLCVANPLLIQQMMEGTSERLLQQMAGSGFGKSQIFCQIFQSGIRIRIIINETPDMPCPSGLVQVLFIKPIRNLQETGSHHLQQQRNFIAAGITPFRQRPGTDANIRQSAVLPVPATANPEAGKSPRKKSRHALCPGESARSLP